MRFLRLIIISLIFFSLIITGISLFIPSRVTISRAIQINNSRQAVMDELSDPVRWRDWYPSAHSADFYYENGTIKGLILDDIKKRYIAINEIRENEVVAAYVLPGRKVQTGWKIAPSAAYNVVTVQWYMDFHLRWYPWEKFSSFMFEKVYGSQLQQGLDNLKRLLER
jgi:polyketide cyclase/dehydrase/lipid transport protein